MLSFELLQEVKVLSGAGAVQKTGEAFASLGVSKVLVVTDPGVVRAGIAARVAQSLEQAGIAHVLFDQVQPDPPSYLIERGYETYRAEGCQGVLAVGGGSAIDTAKGINILAYNPGDILAFCDFSKPMATTRNLIVIPTTSGTGSELSDGLVVTGPEGSKHPILAVNGMTNIAILDPELTLGLSQALTSATGMDAFAHAAEAYTSTAATPLTDIICMGNMQAIHEWLPRAVADGTDLHARAVMQSAAAISGWMLRYGHTHAGHSVAHVLGARLHIPHGLACAYALPWVLRFNAPAAPEKTRGIGLLLGADIVEHDTPEAIGEKTCEALRKFVSQELGLPGACSFEHDPALFDEMALEIERELFQVFNPRPMKAPDARLILEAIFQA